MKKNMKQREFEDWIRTMLFALGFIIGMAIGNLYGAGLI